LTNPGTQIFWICNPSILEFPNPEEKGDNLLATHLSAIKRARQNEKRRLRNLQLNSTVKSSIRKVRMAVEGKDVEGAKKALLTVIPLIQKAQSKSVFHKNASARKISRLTRRVNSLTAVSK
jgi:small subunit ribosomal protein S20